MKKRPTWTRYGKGVIMMGDYPTKGKPGKGEEKTGVKPKNKPTPKS